MPELHVVPDERTATWRVLDGEHAEPRSEHATATDAESAARGQAEADRVERIIIHDRYTRTRQLVRRGYAWLPRRP
jgi:Uncharacterized protein conserved in bacteria (DUF2188)